MDILIYQPFSHRAGVRGKTHTILVTELVVGEGVAFVKQSGSLKAAVVSRCLNSRMVLQYILEATVNGCIGYSSDELK